MDHFRGSSKPLPEHVIARLSIGQYGKLARMSGMSKQHISRALNGYRGLSFHSAARLAMAADVSLDHLYAFILSQPRLTFCGRKTRGDKAAA